MKPSAAADVAAPANRARRADPYELIAVATRNSFIQKIMKDEYDGSLQLHHFAQSPHKGEQIKRGFLRNQWAMYLPSVEAVRIVPATALHGQMVPYSASDETLEHSTHLLTQLAFDSRAAIVDAYRSLPRHTPSSPETTGFRQTLRNIACNLYTKSSKQHGSLLTNTPRLAALLPEIESINAVLALVPDTTEPLLILRDIPTFHSHVQDKIDQAEMLSMAFEGFHFNVDSDSESR